MAPSMIQQLEPWSFQIRPDFYLRGWRTDFRGKPLLHFLHGNGFCGLTYSPLLKELLDDFDLIITDLPGHGDSDSGGDFMGWNACADYCLEVFNHFSADLSKNTPKFALGHSFGGVISALMMAKQKKCFDKALLMDPVIFSPKMVKVMAAADVFGLLQHAPLAKQARGRKTQWADRETVFNSFKGKGTFKGWADEALQAHVDYALTDNHDGVTLKCSVEREADIFSSYPRKLWKSLKSIRTSTQILAAEETFPFIARSLEKLKGHKSYDIHTVEGGHCFMQEDHKRAAQMIKAWFLNQ